MSRIRLQTPLSPERGNCLFHSILNVVFSLCNRYPTWEPN